MQMYILNCTYLRVPSPPGSESFQRDFAICIWKHKKNQTFKTICAAGQNEKKHKNKTKENAKKSKET